LLTLPLRTEQAALCELQQRYRDAALASDDPPLHDIARQVRAFLRGELQEFAVTLDLRGHTAFELAVWAAVARIPHGQTRTYAWVADQVGGGRGAAQAAGAAVGANPIPLIIPCHRVIGADGSLHGFAGGLQMKARLLALESGQGMLDLNALT
ncbi:MAG: methylated-DNA-[protein]-cysteine S-methyltransferase, partial [Chloroflexota bacterium]|nr:methylated-DNA-[protein]-cysteine S-methyltransferase [Chloroflexota bacterium]